MRPCELNILSKRGDTRRLSFVVKRGGRIVNISGWTDFKLGIDSRSEPDDSSTSVAVLTGGLVTDGTDGRCYFLVPETLPVGEFYYDAQAIDENDEIGTFVEGVWKVKEDRAK